MKALKIKNAPQSFGIFLMAMQTPFRYDFGDFIIEDTWHADKFTQWCIYKGVSASVVEKMQIEVVNINCDIETF